MAVTGGVATHEPYVTLSLTDRRQSAIVATNCNLFGRLVEYGSHVSFCRVGAVLAYQPENVTRPTLAAGPTGDGIVTNQRRRARIERRRGSRRLHRHDCRASPVTRARSPPGVRIRGEIRNHTTHPIRIERAAEGPSPSP